MNCQIFENNVTDLARKQPLDAHLLKSAVVHAESCPACALQLEEQRSLSVGLRGLSNEIKAIEISGRVEDQLMAAFRQQMVSPVVSQSNSYRWVALGAIAAVFLVIVGAVAMRMSSVTSTTVSKGIIQAPVEKVTPPQSVALSATPVLEGVNNRIRPNRRTRRMVARSQRPKQLTDLTSTVAQNATNNSSVVEVTTDFMPLGDTSVANLQDGAQVIRVEMPRYAMARFGLPVNMERYDEKVKADVWVGIDGLARAIRFVQ